VFSRFAWHEWRALSLKMACQKRELLIKIHTNEKALTCYARTAQQRKSKVQYPNYNTKLDENGANFSLEGHALHFGYEKGLSGSDIPFDVGGEAKVASVLLA